MVTRAGGDAAFQPDGASKPVRFDAIRQYDSEVLFDGPCGFERLKAVDAVDDLRTHDGWSDVTVVNTGRVYVADGNVLFN